MLGTARGRLRGPLTAAAKAAAREAIDEAGKALVEAYLELGWTPSAPDPLPRGGAPASAQRPHLTLVA